MSNYNMTDEYSKDLKLSLAELFEELFEEIEQTATDSLSGYDKVSFVKVFHNKDNTGINDNLKKYLKFDIDAFSDYSDIEKYNTLRLKKIFINLGYIGVEKSIPNKKEVVKFKESSISSILAKPYYNNLNTRFDNKEKQNNAFYGDAIDYLIKQLKIGMGEVTSKRIEERFEKIEMEWKLNVYSLYNNFLLGNNTEYNFSINELNRIDKCIQNSLLDNLEPYSIPSCPANNGVFQSFYGILICHKILCHEADLFENKYSILDLEPDENYIEAFKELNHRCNKTIDSNNWEENLENLITNSKLTTVLPFDDAVEMLKTGLSDDRSELCKYVWDMITYFSPIPFFDERTLDSKIEKFKEVYIYLLLYQFDEHKRLFDGDNDLSDHIEETEDLNYIDNFSRDYDEDENDVKEENEDNSYNSNRIFPSISLVNIILIMQEVLFIDAEAEPINRKVISRYYRCGSKWNKSAKSIYGKTCDSVVVQSWLIRLGNRYAVNMGKRDLIKTKRKIDLMLYRLKQIVLLNRSPMYAEIASYFISSKLFDIGITNTQMDNHLRVLLQIINHIPQLSCISTIEFLEENKQALRRLTQLSLMKNNLTPYFDFWAKVALELPRYEYSSMCEDDLDEVISDYICKFGFGLRLALEDEVSHIDRGKKRKFNFKVKVKISEGFVERTFIFKCKFEPTYGRLSVIDYSEEMDFDSRCMLDEIGLGNIL